MGTEARIGLLLGAAACLLAAMVDWVVEELSGPEGSESLPGGKPFREAEPFPEAKPVPV